MNYILKEPLKSKLKVISDDDKISWENKTFIEYEETRVGPGEQGKTYNLEDAEEIEQNKEMFLKEGFYVLVSDKISQVRALPDMRPQVWVFFSLKNIF